MTRHDCKECGNTGYRGRTGIYEVMEMTPEIRDAFLQGATHEALCRLSEGKRTLPSEAIRKVQEGGTTLEEVLLLIRFYEHFPA